MADKELNIETVTLHWVESSDKDYQTMLNLYKSADYNWSLFLGHLVIEKLLKAIYVKHKLTHAIFGHDLLRLASKTELTLTDEQEDWLDRLTTFNINTRYDSYKQDFFTLCTKEFADEWIQVIKNLREWLKNQL
jgi:HEPN domain-containing protein